jgi:16S rRNA (guanine527-N7)-methyltransferase
MRFRYSDFPDTETFASTVAQALEENGLVLRSPQKALPGLAQFGAFLCQENEKYNLTAVSSPRGIAVLHFADSLLFSDLIPEDSSCIDIGCGAGLPSVPLALTRDDLSFVCNDATAKKTAFIDAFAEKAGLENIKTLTGRAEELFRSTAGPGSRRSAPGGADACPMSRALRESFDVCITRGVAPLGVLCELCSPAVRTGGLVIALKSRSVGDELPADSSVIRRLGLEPANVTERRLVDGDTEYVRSAVVMVKTGRCGAEYPRKYGEISKRPLF